MGSPAPASFTMPEFVPDFGSSSPGQCERWDRPADNRWATGNAKCCSALVQGNARSGTRGGGRGGGGSTASSPPCSLLHLPPQGWFFPCCLLSNAQSPQRPPQASPLPRIRCSLIPKPGHRRAWEQRSGRCAAAVSPQPQQARCPTLRKRQHPRDTTTGIWGSCCSPLGWICWGRTQAEGGSTLPCRVTASEPTACAAAAGFANAAA